MSTKNNIPIGWKVLNNHVKWLKLDNTLKENHLRSFYNGINAIDQKRGTNFLKVFPKLSPLYDLAKNKI